MYLKFRFEPVLNQFWTSSEPSRTSSGRFCLGLGSVHPWSSRFRFRFRQNGLWTKLNWTLPALHVPLFSVPFIQSLLQVFCTLQQQWRGVDRPHCYGGKMTMTTTQTATPTWDMNNGNVLITTQWPHALHALCMCMFFFWLQLLQFTGWAFTYTHCESKWVIWVRQITQTQHLSKDYEKSEWWCASTVPEGKSLMGKGMLLHQRDDADTDRGHSWRLGVMDDKGNQRLEPSYSLGSARMNTELNGLKIVLLHLEVGAENGQGCSWHPEAMVSDWETA